MAVWYSGKTPGVDEDILAARSTDNGATWTDPATLNTNAATDSGDDHCPQVTTDGLGNWVAVWHSNEPNVGSGIGTDKDILYATWWLMPPVGGIAELPDAAGSSAPNYVALAALAAAALVALTAGAWYARRWWLA